MQTRNVARISIFRHISVAVFGLLSVAVLILALFNDKGLLQVMAQSEKLETIQSEIRAIETDNAKLKADIDNLRHNPEEIERIAREELKLVKPGEVVLMSPDK